MPDERVGEVEKIIACQNAVVAPARFRLIEDYGYFLIYEADIVFSEAGVSADFMEVIVDEAVSRFDFCWSAIVLANSGDKSASEALSCVENKLGCAR